MKIVNASNVWFPSIFEDLFPENSLDVSNYENFSIPKVNISENLTTFVIELAVPGIDKENIAIEVEDDVLKVSSKMSPKRDSSDALENTRLTRQEFDYGTFSKAFSLPETVNTDEIDASYKQGVLTIQLPKKKEEKNIKRMVEIS